MDTVQELSRMKTVLTLWRTKSTVQKLSRMKTVLSLRVLQIAAIPVAICRIAFVQWSLAHFLLIRQFDTANTVPNATGHDDTANSVPSRTIQQMACRFERYNKFRAKQRYPCDIAKSVLNVPALSSGSEQWL